MTSASTKSLYERLGGYDAICAVANSLRPRLVADETLGRFWKNRGDDGMAREKLTRATGISLRSIGRSVGNFSTATLSSGSNWSMKFIF